MDQEVNLSVNLEEFLEQEKLKQCAKFRRPRDVFKVQETSLRRSMILRAFQESPISSTPKPNSKNTHGHNWNFTSIDSSFDNVNEDQSKVSPVSRYPSRKTVLSKSDDVIEPVVPKSPEVSSANNIIESKSNDIIEAVLLSNLDVPSVSPVKIVDDVFESENCLKNADVEVENTPESKQDLTKRQSILLTEGNSQHCNASNKSVRFQDSFKLHVTSCQFQNIGKRNQISNYSQQEGNCELAQRATEEEKKDRNIDDNNQSKKNSPSKLHQSRRRSMSCLMKNNRELFVSLKADVTDNLNFFPSANEETLYDIDFSIKPKPTRFSIDSNSSVNTRRSSVNSRLWRTKYSINLDNENDTENSENIVYNSNISLDPLKCTESVRIKKRVYSKSKRPSKLPGHVKAVEAAHYSLRSLSSDEIDVSNKLFDKSVKTSNQPLHNLEPNSLVALDSNGKNLLQEAQPSCQITSIGQKKSNETYGNNFLDESSNTSQKSPNIKETISEDDTGYEDVTEESQTDSNIKTVGQEREEWKLTRSIGQSKLPENLIDVHEEDDSIPSKSLQEGINSKMNISNQFRNESIKILDRSLFSMATNSEETTDKNGEELTELISQKNKDSEIRLCKDQGNITYQSTSNSKTSSGGSRTLFENRDRVLMGISNTMMNSMETESRTMFKSQFGLNLENYINQKPIVKSHQPLCPRMTGRSIATSTMDNSCQSSNVTLRRSARERKIVRNYSVGVIVLDSQSDLKFLRQLGMDAKDIERACRSLGIEKNKNKTISRKSRVSKRNTGLSNKTIASKETPNNPLDLNHRDNFMGEIVSLQSIDENPTTTETRSKRSQEIMKNKSRQSERKIKKYKRKLNPMANKTETDHTIALGMSPDEENKELQAPPIPTLKKSLNSKETEQLEDCTVNVKRSILASISRQKSKRKLNEISTRTEAVMNLGLSSIDEKKVCKDPPITHMTRLKQKEDDILNLQSTDENATINTSKAEGSNVSQRRSNRNRKPCITYIQELAARGEISYGRKKPKLKNGCQKRKD